MFVCAEVISHLHIFSSLHLHIFTSSQLIFSSSHLVIFICLHVLIFPSYIFTSFCCLISPVHGRYFNWFALLHSTACDSATDFDEYFQWHTPQHFPLASGKRYRCPDSTLFHVASWAAEVDAKQAKGYPGCIQWHWFQDSIRWNHPQPRLQFQIHSSVACGWLPCLPANG